MTMHIRSSKSLNNCYYKLLHNQYNLAYNMQHNPYMYYNNHLYMLHNTDYCNSLHIHTYTIVEL